MAPAILPAVRHHGVGTSPFKTIAITETVNSRFSADFFNLLNMPGNPIPSGVMEF
jgi:hypothetical protein